MCGFIFGLFIMFLITRCAARGCWRGRRYDRFDREGDGRGRRGGFWRRRMLDGLFSRLDTSHGQEKVIREAVTEVEDTLRETKGLGRKHVRNLADSIRSDEFGHDEVAEVWAEQDQALEKVRMSVLNALQSVHGVLEADQRTKLADMIERRFGMGRRGPAW